MTERTKTIKGLISGQVDMGTFGLVELELLAIENDNEALRKHAVSSRREQLIAFSDAINICDGDSEKIGKLVDLYLKSN